MSNSFSKIKEFLQKYFFYSYGFITIFSLLFFLGWYFTNSMITLISLGIALILLVIFDDSYELLGFLLMLTIFTYPTFPYFDTIPSTMISEISIFFIAIITVFIRKCIKKETIFRFGAIGMSLLLLLIILAMSLLVNHFLSTSPYESYAWLTLGIVLLLILIYFIFTSNKLPTKDQMISKVFYILNIVVLMEVITVMIQQKNFTIDYTLTKWGQKNTISIALEIFLPFVAYLFSKNHFRYDAILIIIADIYVIFATNSRGGLISIILLLPLLIYILVYKTSKSVFLYIVALLGTILLITISYFIIPTIKDSFDHLITMKDNISGRDKIWDSSMEYFKKDIFLGGSLSALFDLFKIYSGHKGSVGIWLTHNTFVTILCMGGLLGLIGFIFHLAEIFISNRKSKLPYESSILYILCIGIIHGFIDNTFFSLIYMIPYMYIFSFNQIEGIPYLDLFKNSKVISSMQTPSTVE